MQAFLFSSSFFNVCVLQKEVMVPGIPSRDRGNWDKNRDMSHHHAIFCEESLRKIDAKDVELFQNGSVFEFCCLKALITLEQMNTSVKTLMVRL